MAITLLFNPQPIRRPLGRVAVVQRRFRIRLFARLFPWWHRLPKPTPLPDNMRDDVGLPAATPPRYWLDPTTLTWRVER